MRKLRISLLVLGVVMSACRGKHDDVPGPARLRPVSARGGPLNGLRWSGHPVPVESFLYDDKQTLWSVSLSGDRTALWSHPHAFVTDVAASPDGIEVALAVTLTANTPAAPSGMLYLLDNTGRVKLIDAVRRDTVIEHPVFLKPPVPRGAATRLYWIRFHDEINVSTGRPDSQVVERVGNALARVTVPLRHEEGVVGLDGYPGGDRFTILLARHGDEPTRYEVLASEDANRFTRASSGFLWSSFASRANTDTDVGTAWLTPEDYVVPVTDEKVRDKFTLKLYHVGCEYQGARLLYEGADIDPGSGEKAVWHLLPAGRDRVAVLSKADADAVENGPAKSTTWSTVGPTPTLQRVPATWAPGAWTWVSRSAVASSAAGSCKGFDYRGA